MQSAPNRGDPFLGPVQGSAPVGGGPVLGSVPVGGGPVPGPAPMGRGPVLGSAPMAGGPVTGPIICDEKTTGNHVNHFFHFFSVGKSVYETNFHCLTVVLYINCTLGFNCGKQ
jgi:hypothetical protein